MKTQQIPQTIDEPAQILFWSADEFVPVISLLSIGMLIGAAFWCTGLGFVAAHYFSKYKNSKPDGFLYHQLYWLGFCPVKGLMINPYVREFYS